MKKSKSAILAFVVSSAAIVVYARSISFGFVFDDIENILNNPIILNFRPTQLVQIFLQPWRALTLISYGFTNYIFRFNPVVFHLTNVLIHAIDSVLVFGIAHFAAKRWLSPKKVDLFSVAAGMIFALHPLHSEAVVYVWGRSSSLCALFYFGSLLMLLIGFSRTDGRRMFWFACAAIVAFLAWKTKEEAITLPFAAAGIIALTGAWRAAACTALLPFGLLAARWPSLLHLRAAVAENRELASAGLGAALDPVTYFLTSMKGAVFYYLRLYLLPAGQSADPYIKPVSGFADPSFLAATIILASLVALGFAMRSDRLFLFGLMVLLISPLASYAVMPLADVLAEHRIYISGLGFALLAAWVLARLPRYRYATLSGVAVILGIATLIRVGVWTDSLSLWKDAEAKSPELARPHLNLGMAYQAAGIDNLAMEEYRHALAVNPRLAPAYIDMAGLFFSHNDLDSSETALKKAMDLAPALPAPYINLAQVEMKKGKPEEALNTLNRAPLTSLSYLVHINKGDVYAQLGRYKEAVTEYQEGARLKPDLHEVAELVKQRINRLKEFGVIR